MSKCRQNFHEECEAFINKLINLELYASNCYLTLSAFFQRDDVALKGLTSYFFKLAKRERQLADTLVGYQSQRGGRVVMETVDRPAEQKWTKTVNAIEFALKLEKQLNEALINLHEMATNRHDPHLSDYIKEYFLNERVETINELSRHVTNLEHVAEGLGVYTFDHHVHKDLALQNEEQ